MRTKLITGVLLLGVLGLFLEQMELTAPFWGLLTAVVDYSIIAIVAFEIIEEYLRAPVRKNYLRQHLFSLLSFLVFVTLFGYSKLAAGVNEEFGSLGYLSVIIVRNLFLTLRVISRLRRLSEFMRSVLNQPAQTVVLSFSMAILVGTLLLMMPFTTTDGMGLTFTESLFTATSAVCVTGLIVVDTATAFTLWGWIIIVLLIQIGGLGIMILSYFIIFVIRRSITPEDTMLLSYMLEEGNTDEIRRTVVRIVGFTLSLEGVGGALLGVAFYREGFALGDAAFYGLFHAVSAFCNAGFALFTTSLEQFSANTLVNLVMVLLIVAGGISFVVLTDLWRLFVPPRRSPRGATRGEGNGRARPLGVGSRAVLAVTGVVLLASFLIFYFLEHGKAMAELSLGEQLLASLFQAVTLRTAGFNTLPFDRFQTATYLAMMLFMFVGGASGSTAGGIKVNSVAVIWSYLRSVRTGSGDSILFRHRVSRNQIASAFSVLLLGVTAVFLGTFLLSIFDSFSLVQTLFESVSAFGTVGLSTGITGELSRPGRYVIILLMFVGRVGPLTLLSASTTQEERLRVRYPTADISVG
ncbi:MAG: TrkH family potassium uptake protein [Spirochaetaceae bacterium]